jgi:hypothetical protein
MTMFNPQGAMLACASLLAGLYLGPCRASSEGLDGVWQGTIGRIEIQLCLQDDGSSLVDTTGAYYMLSDGKIVSLEPEDPLAENFVPNSWTETTFDGNDATLILRLEDADHLVGERKGKATDPIALQRVPYVARDYDNPPLTSCGSIAFSAPRIAQGATTQMIPASWHGHSYSRLVLAPGKLDFRLESFQIPGTSPALNVVNNKLAMGFLGLDPNATISDVLRCSSDNLAWSGRDGTYTEIRWPEILTDSILVTGTSFDIYCGGPYPETSTMWEVFNLATGEELDPRTWLLGDKLETLLYGGPSNIDADLAVPGEPSFYEVFLQHYNQTATEGDHCVDLLSTDDNWFIRPSRLGMVFTQELPHVVQACAVDVTIPYGQMWPFLSKAGKKMATEVRKTMQ